MPILFNFHILLATFYTIFGTNILIQCPVPVPVCCMFFVSQKIHIKRSPNGIKTDGDFFGIYSHYQEVGNASAGLNGVVEGFLERNRTSGAGTAHKFDFTSILSNAKLTGRPAYIIEQVTQASGGAGRSGGGTVEFGAGASGSGGASGDGTIQKVYLVSGKSQSGDGKTYAVNQSMYTVVTSSQPTN